MQPELSELNRIREAELLTYSELARAIDIPDASTLHKLLNDRTRKPARRTLRKIREFLDKRRAEKARPAKKETAA